MAPRRLRAARRHCGRLDLQDVARRLVASLNKGYIAGGLAGLRGQDLLAEHLATLRGRAADTAG